MSKKSDRRETERHTRLSTTPSRKHPDIATLITPEVEHDASKAASFRSASMCVSFAFQSIPPGRKVFDVIFDLTDFCAWVGDHKRFYLPPALFSQRFGLRGGGQKIGRLSSVWIPLS